MITPREQHKTKKRLVYGLSIFWALVLVVGFYTTTSLARVQSESGAISSQPYLLPPPTSTHPTTTPTLVPTASPTAVIQTTTEPCTELLGDVNDDCVVDLKDFRFVGSRWGLEENKPLFDSVADFNKNSKIDLADIDVIKRQWGKTCSRP